MHYVMDDQANGGNYFLRSIIKGPSTFAQIELKNEPNENERNEKSVRERKKNSHEKFFPSVTYTNSHIEDESGENLGKNVRSKRFLVSKSCRVTEEEGKKMKEEEDDDE